MGYWEHFDHGADIGIRGVGKSLEEAFAEGACALTAVVTDIESVACRQWLTITCEEEDIELLFVAWLNGLIYEMAVKNMVFSIFNIHINGKKLVANICGEPIDIEKHRPAVEIKGATLTALAVREENGQWIAQCVVDV